MVRPYIASSASPAHKTNKNSSFDPTSLSVLYIYLVLVLLWIDDRLLIQLYCRMGMKKQQKRSIIKSSSLYKWSASVIVPIILYYVFVSNSSQEDAGCIVNGSPICLELLGQKQKITGRKEEAAFQATIKYMRDTVMVDNLYSEDVRAKCRLGHKRCMQKVANGHCEVLEYWAFMDMYCAPACQRCEAFDPLLKCPAYNPETMGPRSIQTGGIHTIFEKLEQLNRYSPHVLSKPESAELDDKPWVLVLDNFTTKQECETLIEIGHEIGFERSKGYIANSFTKSRTSSTAWCIDHSCLKNSTYLQVRDRIADILNVPFSNYEPFQFLHYEKGQFYKPHHDYGEQHRDSMAGVRALTVFLYLNDVEHGGGTNFPLLGNLTVNPKAGRVLIWPSVLDSDPEMIDSRTEHGALEPESGVKYGVNVWVHTGKAQEAFYKDCVKSSQSIVGTGGTVAPINGRIASGGKLPTL